MAKEIPSKAQAFDTVVEECGELLQGPWRLPRQMLAAQQYDSHASIHDDETARQLGFKGGTIEGPTHFSQFAPLGFALWGEPWFAGGCLSVHYRNPCFEGDEVRAIMNKPAPGEALAEIRMERRDGVEVLRGTASIAPHSGQTALEQRLASLRPPENPVILANVKVGMRLPRLTVRMGPEDRMGQLYPFSLSDKLRVITEPSSWYASGDNPWGRPIIPFEMISVLLNHVTGEPSFPKRGPVVDLFADQEIRLVEGPLFVGEPYEMEREVVALSGSRRTESMWVKTSVFAAGTEQRLATMLLNVASLKETYRD